MSEALAEREVLWANAPHIVWPLRFVLPYHTGLRPAWLLRLGLFLYDHIGGRRALPGTRTLNLRSDSAGVPLRDRARQAFEYSDCWVEDSRLVVLNALDARERGAIVETRHRLIEGRRTEGLWQLTMLDTYTGERKSRRAKVLVNAAGPWVGAVAGGALHTNTPARVRLVKGSHIVVRKLFDHDRCYIFQNPDGRIVFAIPYERDFTLIGTTDVDFEGEPRDVTASPKEIAYLCDAANEYFTQTITSDDVVWQFAGVRSLYDDGASDAKDATRDYVLSLDAPPGEAPLLSIFGGKITTYRRLAEAVLDKLKPSLPHTASWTRTVPLPGGDFAIEGFDRLVTDLHQEWPHVAHALLARLARAYGTRAKYVLSDASAATGLGRTFGADLTEAEVRFLVREEWARTTDDILWRRSKLGLRFSPAEVAELDAYLATATSRAAA